MVQVAWTRRATADLVVIARYIAQFSPASARRISLQLKEAAASLSMQPDRGRLVDGAIRELAAVRPYIIRYRVSAGVVRILRIRHSARRPLGSPSGFSEAEWSFFSPFDEIDEFIDARMIAEAEADVAAGRVITNEAMTRWIRSLRAPDELPHPEVGELTAAIRPANPFRTPLYSAQRAADRSSPVADIRRRRQIVTMRTRMPPAFFATLTGPEGNYELDFRPLDEWDGVIEVTIAGEPMTWQVVRGDEEEDGTVSISGMTLGSDLVWKDQFWFELVMKPEPAHINYWGNQALWRRDLAAGADSRS